MPGQKEKLDQHIRVRHQGVWHTGKMKLTAPLCHSQFR